MENKKKIGGKVGEEYKESSISVYLCNVWILCMYISHRVIILIEIQFTHHKIYPLKWIIQGFLMIRKGLDYHHSSSRTFSPPQKKHHPR